MCLSLAHTSAATTAFAACEARDVSARQEQSCFGNQSCFSPSNTIIVVVSSSSSSNTIVF